MKQLIGRKLGMTQVFTEDGERIGVTVLEIPENVVTQVKTAEQEGYKAVQVAAIDTKVKNTNRAQLGHFVANSLPKTDKEIALAAGLKKVRAQSAQMSRTGNEKGAVDKIASVANEAKEKRKLADQRLDKAQPKRVLREMRLDDDQAYAVGDVLKAEDFFAEGQFVDVEGTSKGRGFAGAIKRWGFKRQGMSHGVEKVHRQVGSSGPGTTPAHIRKGLKRAGQMGNKRATNRNVKVVKIEAELGLILVRGAVPGPNGGTIIIKQNTYKRRGGNVTA
jgi:large subunit ribosomal protein L3